MEELKNYILENEDLLEIVREINSYNGGLEWLDYWENDEEFFEVFFDNPMKVARAVCYGSYNYSDEYVKFDAYGNLESCSEYEIDGILKDDIDEIINELIRIYNNLYLDDELVEMIEKYLEEEE